MPENPDNIAELLSDLVDGLEDLTHEVRKVATVKPGKETTQKPEPDQKLTRLLGEFTDAIRRNTDTVAGLAAREPVIPAPVVHVAAPEVTIAPAQINVEAAKPAPKCGFVCEITSRDDNGHIKTFTLTPL